MEARPEDGACKNRTVEMEEETYLLMVATSPYYKRLGFTSQRVRRFKSLTLELTPAREEPSEAMMLLIVTVYEYEH